MRNAIYYDGSCPFCARYVRYLRLRDTVGDVRLVNMRTETDERDRLLAEGWNLDQGMVAEIDGKTYGGHDAVRVLALLSNDSNLFNRINRLALSSRVGASLLYPALRVGRSLTLVGLDRTPLITDDNTQRAFRRLFSMAWGLFAYLHVVVYQFQYGARMYLTTWAIAPLGIALFWSPLSRRIFLALLIVMLLDSWWQLPSTSNHTLLQNALLYALALSGTWHVFRGGHWRGFLADAAPIGRFALACMYVFGVFHKINTDFMNPQISCAVALWQAMPAVLSWFDFPVFYELAIYGTLLIESAILGCLLLARTRHIGIVIGICFHSLLAMSNYSLYAPFSTLTIALHLLYLPPQSARTVVESAPWRAAMTWLRRPIGVATFAAWLAAIAVLTWNGSFSAVGIIWLPVVLFLCYCIWRHGRPQAPESGHWLLWSRLWWVNALSVLFFLACFSPYLGSKTAQSMNMFANLQLEAGKSNHLILRNKPAPFGYLEDVVEIVNPGHSTYLSLVQSNGLYVTYYDLLDKLERDPDLRVSYLRNGRQHLNQTAATLHTDIKNVLHPRWVRGWFHFSPVDLTTPKPCALDR